MSVRTKENWPYCRVTVGGDPHTSKIIGIDFVFYELASTFLVNIDAPRLAVVDLTAYHCRVSVRFHLKPCNPVPVDITALKVALQRETKRQKSGHWLLPKTDEISDWTKIWLNYHAMVKSKHSYVSAMVDMITSDDRIAMVFYPDTRKRIVWDFVIFINTL